MNRITHPYFTLLATMTMLSTRFVVNSFTAPAAVTTRNIASCFGMKHKSQGFWKALPSLYVLNAPSSSSSSVETSSTYVQQVTNNRSSSTSTSTSTSASNLFSIRTNNTNHSDTESQVLQPLIVCGPSGVGKGTIINKFMEELNGKSKFGFTVSHTTRKPRPGEINGTHYHFSNIQSIKKAISNHEFLEYAEVHGNIYGTSFKSLSQLEENGMIPLLDIDVQGVKEIKKRQLSKKDDDYNDEMMPKLQARFIFIAPPSLELLLRRLKSRGTENEESINKRTKNAVAEMEYGMEEGNFDAIIVNDDLDQACAEFETVVNKMYGF